MPVQFVIGMDKCLLFFSVKPLRYHRPRSKVSEILLIIRYDSFLLLTVALPPCWEYFSLLLLIDNIGILHLCYFSAWSLIAWFLCLTSQLILASEYALICTWFLCSCLVQKSNHTRSLLSPSLLCICKKIWVATICYFFCIHQLISLTFAL